MFLLKKLIAPLLFPIPIVFGLLLIGLVRMWTGPGARDRRGRYWILGATLILAVFSFRPLPVAMVANLEGRHQSYSTTIAPDTTIRWIVVLAGGVSDDPSFEDPHRLAASSLVRLAEGIRIARHLPEARLILSGGAPFSSISAAAVMRNVAIELGVDASAIVVEDRSLDTKDQAVTIAEMVDEDPFVLVTSASHMPRSVALFAGQGLSPIPAPTDFLARRSTQFHPGALFPSSLNIRAARTAMREYLGIMWAGLRGQT
jgi:uncharacterized SAM-binding protein YcdF (DUF218 family)